METKIHNLNELFNESSVKNKTNDTLLSLFGLFRIDNMVRRLSLEKHDGISAATLILTLCLFRINGDSIYSAYTSQFHKLMNLGKNCFYRIMNRSSMNWRKLLYSIVVRFQTILRKRGATTNTPKCYIIDDSTLGKSGQKIEKVGRVFDHTSSNYVLGYKALVLAICDGISTLPIDFSLHQESGKRGDHGLSAKVRKKTSKT